MKILGRVSIEPYASFVDEPSGASQFTSAAKTVVLQEHKDVVLIYLDDLQINRLQVDSPEGEYEIL